MRSEFPADRQSSLSYDLLDKVRNKYQQIYLIMSPPRCSSTAFSRVFWEQPSVGYYSHEPFEIVYYNREVLAKVVDKLIIPLELQTVKSVTMDGSGDSLVIKEMPYQVDKYFPALTRIVTKPVIFLIRDPRLNIASRMSKKRVVGDNPIFPQIESGWELLWEQIKHCQLRKIPYLIVDSTDFRNQPAIIFRKIFQQFDLPFNRNMLTWNACTDIDLDNLDGDHRHLYERVLTSNSLQPATEPTPSLEEFPHTSGFRAHVARCLQIYEALRQDSALVKASLSS